ncbi:MAG: exonuclease SbcCD subunit D [Gemmatimonadetes bacterium]|nr:exonuclease SbcCD subunit D [Gemmatimonadota bacterium]
MRIAHLADLHLGFRAYHRVTPRGLNVREADVADAFRHAVARTAELRPDLVLVAGDIFHTVRPSNTSIAEAFRQFSILTERLPGVPVVMIAGNHDSPRSSDTGNILNLFREIPGITVVTEECRHVRIEEIDTSIMCMPHNALAADHEAAMDPDPASAHNLLMLHGTVSGTVAEQKMRYVTEYGGAMVSDTSIGPERWTYVALGHYHLVTELAPNMWYAGAIERTSTNIWMETGEKGFLLYDTGRGRAEFHPLPTRATVDLPRLDGRGMSAAELDEHIRTSVESVPDGIAAKIVRLVITDVPRNLVRELNHKRIREWKAEALHFHLDARPPEVRRRIGSGAPMRRQTLQEQVADYLRAWEPRNPGIERGRLIELATAYVDSAGEG